MRKFFVVFVVCFWTWFVLGGCSKKQTVWQTGELLLGTQVSTGVLKMNLPLTGVLTSKVTDNRFVDVTPDTPIEIKKYTPRSDAEYASEAKRNKEKWDKLTGTVSAVKKVKELKRIVISAGQVDEQQAQEYKDELDREQMRWDGKLLYWIIVIPLWIFIIIIGFYYIIKWWKRYNRLG